MVLSKKPCHFIYLVARKYSDQNTTQDVLNELDLTKIEILIHEVSLH